MIWPSQSDLQVRVTAPPLEGKANRALLRCVADALDLPVSRLTIVSGAGTRHKVLEIKGLDDAEVAHRLGRPDRQ